MTAVRRIPFLFACFAFLCTPLVHAENVAELDEMLEKAGAYMGSEVCSECHLDHAEQMQGKKHGQTADPHSPFADWGCETCHGPGGSHLVNNDDPMVSFKGVTQSPSHIRNAMCQQCHQGEELTEWHASTHEAEDAACADCHKIHEPDSVFDRQEQAAVCYTCHKDKQAQSFRAFRHPVREGKVICSDCHNPHGSVGDASLQQLSINENCYSCHAEKRGPFLWEHPPATEECTLCHQVHGSNHPAMLVKQGPQLCQSCHSQVGGSGNTHTRRMIDFSDTTGGTGRFIASQNCANCHSQVHGTNHPSGAYLQR